MHVYERTVSDDHRTSLSVIADLVTPNARVLDLGMGSGALGKHLQQTKGVVIDGVTLNPEEAALAKAVYRRALVADLDTADLATLLEYDAYDVIVCADVFEHLKFPEKLLAQLRRLLKPQGRLLSSVPNAGYCGLVAELMLGEFRYREEGLLDATHLRFFTHRSLTRWFNSHGWQIGHTERIERPLSESEFAVRIETLPPEVASFIVSQPNALVYQFVMALTPSEVVTSEYEEIPTDNSSDPLQSTDFVSQLYWASASGYDETQKQIARGAIGQTEQTLSFTIPPMTGEPLQGLRLDPADRQGFLQLHGMRITLTDGSALWSWPTQENGVLPMSAWQQHDVVIANLWPMHSTALLLIHGRDPQLELPLSTDQLQLLGQKGGQLELRLGWPMSSDFLVLASHTQFIEADRARLQQTLSKFTDQERELNVRLQTIGELHSSLRHAQAESARQELQLRELKQHLDWIEQSTIFRVTRPLVKFKMRLDALLRRTDTSTDLPWFDPVQRAEHDPTPVDVIVPVYRGLADTQACLTSVLEQQCHTPLRLIVIDDCSPEPELVAWLETLSQQNDQIVLLHNTTNLGFVGTVNRGMSMSESHDVVLLNSDAEVAGNWLDRLQAAAYSNARVATATPLSNNATICSYPRFCESNSLPIGETVSSMDRLCATLLEGQTQEIPTAHGFCMYIRRAALREVGLFDVETFGKGYGEENDFCMRALRNGWTHLAALDVFVRHAGGVSFGQSKKDHELRALDTLRRLYPDYEPMVHRFIRQDPMRKARLVLDMGRLMRSGKPVILNITHNRDGGTIRHQRELAALMQQRCVFVVLAPVNQGVSLRLPGEHEGLDLHFELPEQFGMLLDVLRTLGVAHIHYHHVLGHGDDILNLPGLLGVSHDFTVHDYYSYCPQISLTDHADRYCGEQGLDQCRQCLERRPAPDKISIEAWRDKHLPLIKLARHSFCPTASVADRMIQVAPHAPVRVVPHADVDPTRLPTPAPLPIPGERPLKIVILGALSRIKGADMLESVAQLAARQNAPVEFHLIGYGYRHLLTQPKAQLTVHGAYDETDLPQLLNWLKPDVAWFPAQWPETYSYTLSATLAAGLPIVAPRLGAFADRLTQRPWTWLTDWDMPPQAWLDLLVQIRATHFTTGHAPPLSLSAPGTSPVSDWTYQQDYLDGLPMEAPIAASEAVLAISQRMLPLSLRGSERLRSQASIAVRLLSRLRSSPGLSWLAKHIPAHTQRRVKTWLTGAR